MRQATLLLLLFAVSAAQGAEFVQAVEFPYYEYPRTLWERELVWLKNIGIRTVAFSVPPPRPGDPRSDLQGLLRILRKLGMRAWVRGMAGATPAWLTMQVEPHGGPIAFAESVAGLGVPAPEAPVFRLSATDPSALERSRQIFAAGRGSLVWQQVEDTLSPELRKGVVSFSGDERAGAGTLRRDAALLRTWAAIVPNLRTQRPLRGKLSAVQLFSKGAHGVSAVAVSNHTGETVRQELRIWDPAAKRQITIPSVAVPPGDSLWLPVNVPLASSGLCEDCAAFAPPDRILYATAELDAIEYENGILACEFSAPIAGEVIIQLSRKPSGPLLAGGRPADFDWDEKTMQARLPVPAGSGALRRVRIGLAVEPPDSSAFFATPARLIVGRSNVISTSYSSEDLAGRSRLLVPPQFRAKAIPKSPLEIDYEVTTPADALHGEFVPFALEADGVRLGRARLQVFRPASLRVQEASPLHFGSDAELPSDPPLVSFEPQAGRSLHVVLRNNFPSIQNFVLDAAGQGVSFSPAHIEVSVGAAAERELSMRVYAKETEEGASGLHQATLRLTGAAQIELPLRLVAVGRAQAVAYATDLDGDGARDWVVETQRIRAVFSGTDGRWMEFVAKDAGLNVLPEAGLLAGAGPPVSVKPLGAGFEFAWAKGRRTVHLEAAGDRLIIEGEPALPPEVLISGKRDGLVLTVERPSATRAVYSLQHRSESW